MLTTWEHIISVYKQGRKYIYADKTLYLVFSNSKWHSTSPSVTSGEQYLFMTTLNVILCLIKLSRTMKFCHSENLFIQAWI